MKITITIEDNAQNSGVCVTSDPKFAEIMQMSKSGKLTAAFSYAVAALNRIRELGRESKDKSKLIIPVPRIYGRDS